jgi:hypothetical protein
MQTRSFQLYRRWDRASVRSLNPVAGQLRRANAKSGAPADAGCNSFAYYSSILSADRGELPGSCQSDAEVEVWHPATLRGAKLLWRDVSLAAKAIHIASCNPCHDNRQQFPASGCTQLTEALLACDRLQREAPHICRKIFERRGDRSVRVLQSRRRNGRLKQICFFGRQRPTSA